MGHAVGREGATRAASGNDMMIRKKLEAEPSQEASRGKKHSEKNKTRVLNRTQKLQIFRSFSEFGALVILRLITVRVSHHVNLPLSTCKQKLEASTKSVFFDHNRKQPLYLSPLAKIIVKHGASSEVYIFVVPLHIGCRMQSI